jgi:uncharacterized protein (UPF0335 family)
MNTTQKRKLNAYVGKIEEMVAEMQTILDAAQEVYDSKSERWQDSDAGQDAAEKISQLETAIETLGSAKDEIEECSSE